MSPAELLPALEAVGVRLYLTGPGSIEADVPDPEPPGVPELLAEVRRQRGEVLALLTVPVPPAAGANPIAGENLEKLIADPEPPPATVIPPDPVTRIRAALGPDGPGHVAIRSRTLGCTVVWTRSEDTALPHRLAGLTRYTKAELDLLVDARPATLVDLHRIKTLVGGSLTDLVEVTP